MTKQDIKKIEKYLEEKKDNPFAQSVLKKIRKVPDYGKSAVIQNSINYKIIRKILNGDTE